MCMGSKKRVNSTIYRLFLKSLTLGRSLHNHGQFLTAVFTQENLSKTPVIEVFLQKPTPCSDGIRIALIERYEDWHISTAQSEKHPTLSAY